MVGADIIARIFEKHGLKRVFTFPGGTIAPLLDALNRKDMETVCARHEQGAGYMALAIARLTKTPQVVMVTSGPGATNIVTVVADAYFDSTPLIAITGQVSTADINSGRKVRQCGFQQVDTVSIMKPVTKAVFQPKSPEDLPVMIDEAFNVSKSGRPGPVVIDLPMDVQRNKFKGNVDVMDYKPNIPTELDMESIDKVSELLAGANQPVIFAGQGVLLSNAVKELRQLAEERNIPVVMSLLGLGAFPSDSGLSLGFAGFTGNQYAGLAVHNADVLLCVGARLDVRQTGSCTDQFVPQGKVIRIDMDISELKYSRVKSDFDIHSDAKIALLYLIESLKRKPVKNLNHWQTQIDKWKKLYPLSYNGDKRLLKPQRIIEIVNELTSGRNVVVTSGVGSHQQWSARHFDFDFPERVWLTSGGHGAMGYDLPSAIGAQMARPDDLVICFVGDGSFQINIQELQSVVEYNTPIKIFVIDNKRLALVSQFQLSNWSSDPTTGNKNNPDFAAVARAYGIKAYSIDNPDDAESIIDQALKHDGPALINCLVDYHEDVVPMMLAHQTMDKMWPLKEQEM